MITSVAILSARQRPDARDLTKYELDDLAKRPEPNEWSGRFSFHFVMDAQRMKPNPWRV